MTHGRQGGAVVCTVLGSVPGLEFAYMHVEFACYSLVCVGFLSVLG